MNFSLNINSVLMDIEDTDNSNSVNWIDLELKRDDYKLNRIDFRKNDVVIDIGAHVGVFSIYLALTRPDLRIIAIEPEKTNFKNLQRNIIKNKIYNIQTINAAVTDKEGDITLFRPLCNSGGTSIYTPGRYECIQSVAPAITLNSIFERFSIEQCKLLKIDCEGSEYKIFEGFSYFDRIHCISGEIHKGPGIPHCMMLSQAFTEMIHRKFPEDKISFGYAYNR